MWKGFFEREGTKRDLQENLRRKSQMGRRDREGFPEGAM